MSLHRGRLALAGASQPVLVREAAMTPTQDRWSRPYGRRDSYSYGPSYGSSSRSTSRQGGFFDGLFGSDSDWDRPRDTYRTVCVRMCDGYFFPVSFSVTPDRFERDRQSCENSCGADGRLFVYRNPGGEPEDMHDLQGKPYRQLRTAFLYRTEYVADCKCKPHPWEQQARDQHRVYALASAKRKGDKAAAAQLAALQAQMREPSAEARPTKAARWSKGSDTDARDPAKAEQRSLAQCGQRRPGDASRRTAAHRRLASRVAGSSPIARATGWAICGSVPTELGRANALNCIVAVQQKLALAHA